MGDLQQGDHRRHEVQLVHADSGSRVVLVRILQGDTTIDAALGEGASAEQAEDRARQRLQARQHHSPSEPVHDTAPPSRAPVQAQPVPRPAAAPAPIAAAHPAPTPPPTSPEEPPKEAYQEAHEEPPADPEDWSSDLARLDLELQRLGWDRDQEAIYLQRVFNHPNRNRLTRYGDLLAYLQALEGFAPGTDPATAPAPLRRRELLSHCDTLLNQLQWDPGQGRSFLEQHFALTSRQQLSDAQLLQFNMLLESEWLAHQSAVG